MAADPVILGSEDIRYYPHYGFSDEGEQHKELTGYIRELMDRFAADTQLDLLYQLMPVKRLYGRFFAQEGVHLKYPDSPDWQPRLRSNIDIHYSAPVVTVIDGVFTKRKRRQGAVGFRRLGIIRGFTPEAYVGAIQAGKVSLLEYNRASDLLMALLADRVDGVYLNVDVARYHLKAMGISEKQVFFDPLLPHKQVAYRLSSITRSDVIQLFDDWFSRNYAFVCDLKIKYSFVQDECFQ